MQTQRCTLLLIALFMMTLLSLSPPIAARDLKIDYNPETNTWTPDLKSLRFHDTVVFAVIANPNYYTANITVTQSSPNTTVPSLVQKDILGQTGSASGSSSSAVTPYVSKGTDDSSFANAVSQYAAAQREVRQLDNLYNIVQALVKSDPSVGSIQRQVQQLANQLTGASATGVSKVDFSSIATSLTDAYSAEQKAFVALNSPTRDAVKSDQSVSQAYLPDEADVQSTQDVVNQVLTGALFELPHDPVDINGLDVDVTVSITKKSPNGSSVAAPNPAPGVPAPAPVPVPVPGAAAAPAPAPAAAAAPAAPTGAGQSGSTTSGNGTTAGIQTVTSSPAVSKHYSVDGNPRPTFSTGVLFSNLVNDTFFERTNSTTKVVTVAATHDSFSTTLGELVNVPISGDDEWNLSFAVGLSNSIPVYGGGLTYAFGRDQRTLITIGGLGGQVSELPGYNVGDVVPASPSGGTVSLPAAVKVLRWGWMFGLSYNL